MLRIGIAYGLLTILMLGGGWIAWRTINHYRREHERVWGRRRRR